MSALLPLAPLHGWPQTVSETLAGGDAIVRVVVASVRGSAPRDVGTVMLVGPERTYGTIGGGQLEHTAIAAARAMLSDDAPPATLRQFILGPELAQCCGGAVELLLERYIPADLPILRAMTAAAALQVVLERGVLRRSVLTQRVAAGLSHIDDRIVWQEPLHDIRPSVWIYGAGHVGQALVLALARLPVSVTWIDSRQDLLHDAPQVTTRFSEDPVTTVRDAAPTTHFVVMTHSHPLDYALCRAILERGDAAWIGVIGSLSKAARFRSRLAREGVPPSAIARLTCPIGIDGIHGKDPAIIAISVAAQLLRAFETIPHVHDAHPCPAAASDGACTSCELSRVTS